MISVPRQIRSSLAGVAVLAALLAGWIGRGALHPVPADGSITAFGDWRLVCPALSQAEADCHLIQDYSDTRTGVTTLRFVLYGDFKTTDILLPHNVLLPKGIGIKLDDSDPANFDFRTCTVTGCLVTIASDAKFFGRVSHAKAIFITYTDVGGRAIARKLSDKGLSDAVAALSDAQATRHSWIRRVLW